MQTVICDTMFGWQMMLLLCEQKILNNRCTYKGISLGTSYMYMENKNVKIVLVIGISTIDKTDKARQKTRKDRSATLQ